MNERIFIFLNLNYWYWFIMRDLNHKYIFYINRNVIQNFLNYMILHFSVSKENYIECTSAVFVE